jgi:hypothetical protein
MEENFLASLASGFPLWPRRLFSYMQPLPGLPLV